MARTITLTPRPTSLIIDSLEDFGIIIRSLRTQQQLRIDDAAALCGVSVQLLSDLENGRRSVGLDKALSVARQLGLVILAIPRAELPQNLAQLEQDKS